ncbi:hypothetical protein J6590_053209 [Homalodisca vitripennis]|nr:hypothetical protein J6590_053209 [Homalodisca vitripennis]
MHADAPLQAEPDQVMTPSVLRPTSQTAVRSIQPRAATTPVLRGAPTNALRPQPRALAPSASPALVPLSSVITSTGKPSNRNSPTTIRIKPTGKTKANEASSIGGIVQNKTPGSSKSSAEVVDLTDDDGKSNAPQADSKEVMFNKLSGKTYPSLVVVARPYLRTKEVSQALISSERSTLGESLGPVELSREIFNSDTKITVKTTTLADSVVCCFITFP